MSTEPEEIHQLGPTTDIDSANHEMTHSELSAPRRQTHPGPPKSIIRQYIESAIVTVVMVLFGMTFVVQAVKVPTGSMENTIKVGDHLLVNKWIFAPHDKFTGRFLPYRDVRRGDIIVFKYPLDPSIPYVKRVIGLPGEKIAIKGKRVYINDKLLPEGYILTEPQTEQNQNAALSPIPGRKPFTPSDQAYRDFYGDQPFMKYHVYYFAHIFSPDENPAGDFSERDSIRGRQTNASVRPCLFNQPAHEANPGLSRQLFGVESPCVIQPGQYFAMGDNRDNSQDSRYWGTVPRANIFGRPLVTFWSYDESSSSDQASGKSNVSLAEFFRRIRWRDMGHLIR